MTGNVWLDQTDATLPGVRTTLQLKRSYNSALAEVPGREFGRGWSHGYENQITHPAAHGLQLRLGDGRPIYFEEDIQVEGKFNPFLPRTEKSYVLQSSTTPTIYTRHFPDGSQEVYNAAGRLISIVDAIGATTELTYDLATGRLETISDPLSDPPGSRKLTLEYNPSAPTLVETLRGPGGQLIASYFYEGDKLKRVEYADSADTGPEKDGGFIFEFGHPSYPNAIREVKDLDGTKVLERHAYDGGHRGTTSEVGPEATPSEKYTLQYLTAVTRVTDGRGNVTDYRHGSVAGIDRVMRIQGPCSCPGGGQQIQRWEYDLEGRIISYNDGVGVETTYSYVDKGLDTETRRPTPSTTHVTSYTYHPDGRTHTITDPNGAVTTIEYVAAGPRSITETISPGRSRVTLISYTPQGKPQYITDPRNNVWELYFNGLGDLEWTKDPLPLLHETTFEYDTMGRRTRPIPPITAPLIAPPVSAYDTLGRVWKVTNPDDNTFTEFTYDGGGHRTKIRDALGRITDFGYDLHGRLETVINRGPIAADDIVTQYGYNLMSKVETITDGRGNVTTFDYEGFNRLKTITYPGGGEPERFTYDDAGRLWTRKDRKLVTTTFTYDGLGRLTDKTFSNGAPSVSFRYDEGTSQKGRLTSAWRGTPPTSTLAWTYDLAGQIKTETSSRTTGTSVVGYDYDDAGNRKELFLDQLSRVRYTYDNRGLPEFIQRVLPNPPATSDFHLTFDAAGRRAELDYPNGIETGYWYDSRSRLSRVKVQGNSVIADLTYPTYDAVDNRKERGGTGAPPETYEPDHFYRLDWVKRAGTPTEDYGYDKVGNRLSSLTLPTWGYNDRNQLQSNGAASFTYDVNGNVATKTESGANWIYTWDEEDHLKRITLNGALMAEYVYDPLGRRIERTAPGPVLHTYVYDGEDILLQDFTSVLVEPGLLDPAPHLYIHGPGIDEPLAVVHGNQAVWNYHADGLGSIIAVTDNATQQITFSRTYDAFGVPEPNGADEEGYAYTGREWEPDTGLYYYRARYYDPKIGRFISEDPIGFTAGVNFYAYVRNNPVNRIDPSGLSDIGWPGIRYAPPPPPTCKNCTLQVSCGTTDNTFGWLHCTVTVCNGTACTAYDGAPQGGIFGGRLIVTKAPTTPTPAGSQTSQVPCECAEEAAQQVNGGDVTYLLPFTNSNSAASKMTRNCGVWYDYPWRAWGAY